jgi:hypothetical protein
LRSLPHFEVAAESLTEALDECDIRLGERGVAEEHVVSVNVLESSDHAARVVLVYWRYATVG